VRREGRRRVPLRLRPRSHGLPANDTGRGASGRVDLGRQRRDGPGAGPRVGRREKRRTARHGLLPRRGRLGVRGKEDGNEWEEGQTMNDKTSIQPGRYRHYKGNEYTVIGTARHSETLEEMVVYRQEYGEHGLWVRPKQMFSETVNVDGQDVPRFQPLESSSEPVGEGIKNIFDDLPQHLPKELVQVLVRAGDVRI